MMREAVRVHVRDIEAVGLMTGVDSRGNLQIELSIRICAGTPVFVEYETDFCAMGDAMYCRERGSGSLIGVRIRGERQAAPCFETAGSALIEVVGRRGTGVVVAEIQHISLSGAGFVTNRAFAAGSVLRIETKTWLAFGEVCHSTRSEDGSHFTGVVFVTERFAKSSQRGGASEPNTMVESTV